jgi:SAM-dependent methyltransferase
LPQAIPGIQRRYYFAIFILASAALSYQILITRFFSVMLYYHFAFAAISLAMLGLTRGAMEVYGNPDRYAPERVGVEFARHATWFAISGVGAMIAFLCLPLVIPEEYLPTALAVTTVAFVWPFTEGGVCITLLLTRLPYGGGWLYAADLLGAALGCLGLIFALLVVDPVSATLWIGAFAACAGWVVVRDGDDVQSLRLSRAVALTLAIAALAHTGLAASGQSHFGVFWAKGRQQTGTLFERWNTYSRVRVRPLGETTPFGWGFAHPHSTKIDQHLLDIDADAGTVITRHDGDIGKLSYLKDDVINAAYLVQPPADVAVVGVGGGRDILSALLFGAKRVRGIEINPAIFEVLTDKFAEFSGHLHRHPGVSLVNAEARSYINGSSERYDLVQISLIDTWAATAAGGLTLTENRLYTVEAWDDFYRALNPGGMLSVSRWYKPDMHRGEFYRLVAIAAAALQRQGVPAAELPHHVIAVNVGDVVTVITRPDSLTDAQWHGARSRLLAQGFLPVVAGKYCSLDRRQSVLLLYGAAPGCIHRVLIALRQQQCGDCVDSRARRADASRLRVLHRRSLRPPVAADAAGGADAAGHVFQRHRHGLHADRDIADAAADGLPWPSCVFAGRRALYNSAFWRARQRHDRCASGPTGCHYRARCRTRGHARGDWVFDSPGHHMGPGGIDRHAYSGIDAASGAASVRHGNDVPARPQYLAPSLGASAVLLERQRDHVDVCLGAGHGLVHRGRDRQYLRARRLLLCRLRRCDRCQPAG